VKRLSDRAGTQPVAETTHTFDPLNRLSTINHSRGGVPLASYNYGYDANSRITRVTNKDGTSTNTYDDTDQLTGVNYNGSQPDEAYTYDANGNRTNPGYVTGANNRLLSDGKFNYEYDGEGNVISQTDILTGEIMQYTWDYRNRLTNVKRNGVTVGDYAYDVYDQRIGKVTPTGTERFVYGQNQNIALEFDGSGALTNRYLHGNSIDEVLADEANGSVGWTLTDNLGSVRDVVDGTGTSQNHVVFGSFGNVTSETNPSFKTRFSFTGREFDAESGNYDYRSRSYNPGSGRFMEEDPIGFSAGDPNLYRYVLNSPIRFIDPLGLDVGTRTVDNLQGIGGLRGGFGGTPLYAPGIPQTISIFGYPIPRAQDYSRPNIRLILPDVPTGGEQNDQIEQYYRRRQMRGSVRTDLIDYFLQNREVLDPSYFPPNPNECPDEKGRECKRRFANVRLGGSYISVRAGNYSGQAHHAPSWEAISQSGIELGQGASVNFKYNPSRKGNSGFDQIKPFGYFIAPAICMTTQDHFKTISFGGRSGGYVSQVTPLIRRGDFLSAQQVDIQDIKRIARESGDPSKYDVGVTQMVSYTQRWISAYPDLFRVS
jgi:RHS repeat-associated protein